MNLYTGIVSMFSDGRRVLLKIEIARVDKKGRTTSGAYAIQSISECVAIIKQCFDKFGLCETCGVPQLWLLYGAAMYGCPINASSHPAWFFRWGERCRFVLYLSRANHGRREFVFLSPLWEASLHALQVYASTWKISGSSWIVNRNRILCPVCQVPMDEVEVEVIAVHQDE